MSTNMRAVDIKNGAGPATALFINPDVPKPSAKPDEVLVHVKAFGLNRADTLQRQGNYPVPPHASKILGLEFAGIVEEVGDGEGDGKHKFWKGEEVFGLVYGGGYAEYVVVSKKMLIRKPKELGWEVCAGVCETWFTALQAIYMVGGYTPETCKSVLWHAGASSVSIAGIQLCLAANKSSSSSSSTSQTPPPKVFATARQDSKCDFCVHTLHATGAVNTTKNDGRWADEIKKLNDGNGIDLVVDFMGASYFAQNLEVLARDGRVVQLGAMGGTKLPDGVDIGPLLMKRARFEGSTLRSRDPEYQGRLRDLFEEKALEGLRSGEFECHVDRVLPWEQIVEAHQAMERNETKRKVICTIDWAA